MPDSIPSRIRSHADKRLDFSVDTAADTVRSATKEFLRVEGELLARQSEQGQGGLANAAERAAAYDMVLSRLWEWAMKCFSAEHGEFPCAVTMCALGGYGRAEMCPFSDVDIMFLYPAKVRSPKLGMAQKYVADKILYLLWDLGLKVGHSTRDVPAALEEAKSDVQTKNAILEARFIAGDRQLFDNFTETYRRFLKKDDVMAYIKALLKDQAERHERYGGSVFMQEPDIKNGVGGLRDFHNSKWVIRLKLGIENLEALVRRKYLTEEEHKAFIAAYDFLLKVRTALHLQSTRATELLDLEKQPAIAWRLGYKQKDIFRRVEAFMKDYYLHAECIYLTASYLEKRLELESNSYISFAAVLESRRFAKRVDVDGFYVQKGEIAAEHSMVFKEDPERIIRVFRHAQLHEAELTFDLKRLIRENLSLIDEKVIKSSGANRAFRALMQEAGQVYHTLNTMRELGVLGRFVPEFSELLCLVQHEYYHRYTADVHTLSTIRELDGIFLGNEEGLTGKYKKELHNTEHPTLLYLILFLHDIGKARGIEGHAAIGAEMAEVMLKRMGVNPELHAKILFVIRNHLEMARFWQHYDIDDPRTSQTFADHVQNAENLRYLYVHNFCDARGTAQGLWNGYKDTLHTELFYQTLHALGEKPAIPGQKTMTPIETIKEQLPEISPEEIEAHYNLLPERYFVYSSVDEIVLHIKMVNELLRRIAASPNVGTLVPVIEWDDDLSLGMTVVHVVTWDRAGLFFKLAGAFSVAGLSIISSKALSRSDHITIDTFYVSDPSGGVVRNKKARDVFQIHLEDALLRNKDLLPDIESQARKHSKPAYLTKSDHLRAPIPPSVDVYHELSLKRTIIEVQANDTIGLLYKLAKAIHDHGFDITFARISTERNVAVDTFYIEPTHAKKDGEDANGLLALRDALNRIIVPQLEALAK